MQTKSHVSTNPQTTSGPPPPPPPPPAKEKPDHYRRGLQDCILTLLSKGVFGIYYYSCILQLEPLALSQLIIHCLPNTITYIRRVECVKSRKPDKSAVYQSCHQTLLQSSSLKMCLIECRVFSTAQNSSKEHTI